MVITMYYLNYFFLFSILGHLIETIFVSHFESGILYGWWTPVYGIGVVLILFIGKWIQSFSFQKKRILQIFLTYLICMILLSFIEMIGGYLIEWIFHQTFWNYENHQFPIGSYISLDMANLWGIASIFVLYVLKPFCDKIVKVIPKWITFLLSFLFLIDLGITFLNK